MSKDILCMSKHSLLSVHSSMVLHLSHVTSVLSLRQVFLFLGSLQFFFLVLHTSRMYCYFSLPFCAHCSWQEFIPFKIWLETKILFLTRSVMFVVPCLYSAFSLEGFVFWIMCCVSLVSSLEVRMRLTVCVVCTVALTKWLIPLPQTK